MLTLFRFAVALAFSSSIFGITIPAAPSRRSGELWEGLEHEVDLGGLTPSRRSGELWETFPSIDALSYTISFRI
ncbi:hypothetical protein BD769DRAFT_1673714 [Suillus cothurnatus]|nr:hypothetical protein BD769DRAFT_1673714 [Suillus cothurnatus]